MQQANQPADSAVGSPAATGATGTATNKSQVNGGRFDFDDGGTYCGGWEEGKAHGHGVCTGPKGQGAYSGSWHYGFEVSGVYTWPSGSCFEGQWQNGKRHGLGVETRGRWIYRGEWTQGFKGRYGVRQSNTSTAKYEGTWANGLQDGYGSETYADDGTYQGQWMRGMRHGYGVRTSAPFGKASKYRANNKALRTSMTSLRSNESQAGGVSAAADARDRRVDDSRGGFVLKMNSDEPTVRRRSLGSGHLRKGILMGLKLKKQRSTGDLDKGTAGSGSIRSTASTVSWVSTESEMTNASIPSDSNASFVVENEHMDPGVTETYMGEWKNDKRSGYGLSERSDGLKYEGEWYNNKKYGYGVTTFSNGEKEEGKYKNNVLITSQKKKIFLMRSAKFRERIDAAVNAAQRASKIALQKADIGITRTSTSRGKAEQADLCAAQAKQDSEVAEAVAKQYAPDFKQPGLERLKARQLKYQILQKSSIDQKNYLTNDISNQLPNEILGQLPNQYPHPTDKMHSVTSQQNSPQMSNQLPNNLIKNQNEQTSNQLSKENTRAPSIPTLNTYIYHNQSPQNSSQAQYQHQQQQNQQQQQQYQQQQQQQRLYMHSAQSSQNSSNAQYTQNQQQQNQQQQNQQQQNQQQQNQQQQNQQQHQQQLQQRIRQQQYQQQQNQSTNQDYSNQMNYDQHNAMKQNDSTPPQPSIRRMSRRVSGEKPMLGSIGQQSSIDHFDHYKRPPSRDSSVDRYSKATGRLSGLGSRQASIDRTSRPSETPDRSQRAPSVMRGTTPQPNLLPSARNGSVMTGVATKPEVNNTASQQPFEEIIIRRRGLGQDIIPSVIQPKRTESLYVSGNPAPQTPKNLVNQTSLQRKKSLPDVQELPKVIHAMPREEVSALGSARREEVRRMADEKEKLRANPLLYLVSPQVKNWFARQQLVIIVLLFNVSLAILFFKLLT